MRTFLMPWSDTQDSCFSWGMAFEPTNPPALPDLALFVFLSFVTKSRDCHTLIKMYLSSIEVSAPCNPND